MIVFLVALVVRALYLMESHGNPTFFAPIIDSNYYDRAANEWLQGNGLPFQFFFQPIFYPVFLAMVYSVTGSSILWAKAIQAVIGALTCTLAARLGISLLGTRTGLAAGVAAAFYGPLFFTEGELLSEGWAVFWAILLLVLLHERVWARGVFGLVSLGLCLALSTLTRPTFLPFSFVASIWVFRSIWKERQSVFAAASCVVAMFLGFLLITGPVSMLFYRHMGSFGFLPTSGGVNFFIGNNPHYEETIAVRPGIHYDAMINQSFKEGLILETDAERAAYFYRKTIDYAVNEPLQYVSGLLGKAVELLSSREVPNNIDIYIFRDWSSLLSLLVWKGWGFGFPFGVILPFSLVTLVFASRRIPLPIWLFLASYTASIVLVHVNGRYRLPVIPPLILIAAVGISEWIRSFRKGPLWSTSAGENQRNSAARQGRTGESRRHWFRPVRNTWLRSFAMLGVICLGIVVSTFPGPFPPEKVNYRAEMHTLLAEFYTLRGYPKEAREAVAQALRVDPRFVDGHVEMGNVLLSLDDPAGALQSYLKALELDPKRFEALNNSAKIISDRGEPAEALRLYVRALEASPDARRAAQVRVNMGLALLKMGDLVGARTDFEKAVQLQPRLGEAFNGLGMVHARFGDYSKAIGYYQQALTLDARSVQARINLGVALADSKRFEEAIVQYLEALRSDPKSATAHHNLGIALMQLGRLEEAVSHFSIALEIAPGYTKARIHLGLALLELGEYKAAAEHLQQAAREMPNNPIVKEKLCRALWLAGERDAAMKEIRGLEAIDGEMGRTTREWMTRAIAQ
ncbi:MAG: tetratricopeptide repeat protein [Syntrophobacteraceae bacterium]